jgi:hypothetical protein
MFGKEEAPEEHEKPLLENYVYLSEITPELVRDIFAIFISVYP